MPNVEIPDGLKDNLLLKVVKHQIAVLHADMNNEKDEGPASSKVKVENGTGKALRQRQALSRQRGAC